MSVYKVVDTEKLESDLTGMADEVRTLADTTDKMSLEAMTDNVAQANEKVDSQSEVIAQIKTALQGKTVGNKEEQEKSITVTENGRCEVLPDEGYTLSGVDVNVDVEDMITKLTNDEIVEYSNGNITKLPQSIFYGKENLQKISLTNCHTVNNQAFYGCAHLISLHLPNLEKLTGSNIFQNCYILPEACFPKLEGTVGMRSFCNDRTLNKIDLGYVTQISGASVFYSTSSLETLILRSSTLCVLSGTDPFGYGGLANGTGYIYVPKVLEDGSDGVEAYKSATNWSVFANQFRAIEDYPEITGGII